MKHSRFTAPCGYSTARRAGLRGIRRVHQKQHAAGPLKLVAQHLAELSPSLIENGFVQSRFLPDIASGLLDGTLCGRRHVLHFQIFQYHHRVVFADDRTDLMQNGLAHLRDTLMQSRDFGLLLFPVG